MMQCKRVLEEFQSKFLDVKNMVITCPVDLVRRHLVGQGCEGNHGGLMAATAATLRALLR
jgi:hypothetical protein